MTKGKSSRPPGRRATVRVKTARGRTVSSQRWLQRQLNDPYVAEAKKRGYRMKGGELDLEKAAITLLTDYRSGSIGRISLETPETRREMLAAALPVPVEASEETPEADD